MFPHQLAIVRPQAICMAVIGAEIDLALPVGRSDAHGTAGTKRPVLPAGGRVKAVQRVISRGAEVDGLSHRDHVEHQVVTSHRRQPVNFTPGVPLRRARPGRTGRRRAAPGPLQTQRRRVDLFGGEAASADVVLIGGPVGRLCPAATEQGKYCQRGGTTGFEYLPLHHRTRSPC